MKLASRRLEHKSARIELWADAGNVIRMEGVMREAHVGEWLIPLIDEIHSQARMAEFREVVLDIRAVEYANAAFWRCLVRWVKRLREASDATYTLRILSDPLRSWQKVGIPALQTFSISGSDGQRLILDGVRL